MKARHPRHRHHRPLSVTATAASDRVGAALGLMLGGLALAAAALPQPTAAAPARADTASIESLIGPTSSRFT